MIELHKTRHDLLNSIAVGFLVTDSHARIVYVNRHAEILLGYEKSEIEGLPLRTFFLEDDLIYFLPNILYLTLYREGFDGEVLLRRRDGTKIFVRLMTSSFQEEGEVFLTFSIQEIQRMKTLERERLEAERWASLGRMVEEIAHQVRNPIVSIGGFAKRLLKTVSPSPKSYSYLDQIIQEAKKLETMIQRVEEYVHTPKPVLERQSIQEVVETALQSFSKEALEAGVSFNLETGKLKGQGELFLDKGLVVKVLIHLFRNSLESLSGIPRKSQRLEVKVSLLEDGDNLIATISDKGEGIPKKHLKHIFDPFFSTRPDHVGLGLTLVRRVMGDHGGEIRVDSTLQRGTTVFLLFPKDRRRKIRREFVSPEVAAKAS